MSPCALPYSEHTKLAILYVDPDPVRRRYFRQLFKEHFEILDASDESGALATLRRQDGKIAIVILDEALLEERGNLLKTSLTSYPQVIHIISVGFARLVSDLGAYHEAGQLRHIIKPWDAAHVEIKLRRAMEFQILRQRPDPSAARSPLMVADGVS